MNTGSPNSDFWLVCIFRIQSKKGELQSKSRCLDLMRENTDQKNFEFGDFPRSAKDTEATDNTGLK